MVTISSVLNPRVIYEERSCEVCGTSFSVRNNKGDRNKRTCSKSCATTLRHSKGWKSGPDLGANWNKNPSLRPTLHPTNMDIAWAAGIYEGEGSVAIPKHSPDSIQVHVGQKEEWLTYRLRNLFGGSVCHRTMNDQPFFEWQVSGARARGFLMTIYIFMSPRRQDQIGAAL